MRHLLAALALFPLGGCVAVEKAENAALQVAVPKIIAVNNALVRLDKYDLPKACARLGVAAKYYGDVAYLLPIEYQTAGAITIAAVTDVCNVPPQNVVEAFDRLDALWIKLQALTTVPKK